MSKISVTTIAGLTSGGDANVVKIESGDTFQALSNATVGGTLGVTGNTTLGGTAAITGNTTVGGTLVNTGLITASAGVAVGGTGAANTIDDYEEGAWTPTTPNAGTMTNGEGRYIKVGHMVTVWCYVASISNTTSTNAFDIGGLPFTSVGASTMDSTVGPVMIRYIDDNATEPLTITSYLSNASNILTFYVSRGNSDSYGRVLHSHFNSANIGLRTQLSYEVS